MNLITANKGTLIDIADRNQALRSLKNKNTFKDGINQRANIKQRQLVDTIKKVAKCSITVEEPDLCKKEILFDNLPYLDSLRMSYFTKNNLFARIFELIIKSDFTASTENTVKTDVELGISYKGTLKASSVSITPLLQNEATRCLADRLNEIALISKRLLYLETLDMKIRFSASSNTWTIGFATGKGSTVWTLFPPVLMLVPFTEVDAIRLLELYQLLTYEIKQFELDSQKV